MLNEKDIQKINYFNEIISIEEIKKGYDGRKKYKVITNNKKYFIKILPTLMNKIEIEKTKKLYEI